MTFLPLIERELRARSRAPGSYWLRFGVGLAGVLFFLPQFFSVGVAPAVIGKGVFEALAGTAFALCCGATVVAADTVSRERREGTLGLLFLTRVKSLDVVTGKLGSAGVASLCALMQCPDRTQRRRDEEFDHGRRQGAGYGPAEDHLAGRW